MKENTTQNNTTDSKAHLSSELLQCFRRAEARKKLCPHLQHKDKASKDKMQARNLSQNELCLALASQETILWAKAGAKSDEIQPEDSKNETKSELYQQAGQLSDLLDAIYSLESECFKTHKALVRLAQSISALDNFEQNKARFTGIHSFNRGYIFTKPIYETLQRYSCEVYGMGVVVEYDCTYKYDLMSYDKNALKQIALMKEYLKERQIWLDESVAWLDECILRQKDFAPYTALDNPIPSDAQRPFFDFIMNEKQRKKLLDKIAKERVVLKRADFAKFTPDEKEKLEKIAQQAKKLQRLITNNFVKDNKWQDTQMLIDEKTISPLMLALGLD